MQHSTSEIYLKFHRISICKGGESWYIESQLHNITPYINKIRTRKHRQIHCCQLAMSPRGHWGERTQLCLVNQTLPSWIHLPQEEPTPTILQSLLFSNFEPFDLSISPSILNLLYSAEFWNYLMIYEFVHQFWILMLCLYQSCLALTCPVQSSVCLWSILIYYLVFFISELED